MLRIAICDDESFYREKISRLLEEYLKNRDLNYSVHFFLSGEEFLEQNHIKYDIVFMDISMEHLNGIDTAIRMRSFHPETFLVFVTAYIDYALEGYKANAVRYLMKSDLDAAMAECMDAILRKMYRAQVSFSFLDGPRQLYTENILYVESQKHKSIFYCTETEPEIYQIYSKLDAIEQRLSDRGFLRIHKSYLVNLKHVWKINNYIAYLDTGTKLPIPRSRFQSVKEAFVAYKGVI